MTKVSFISLSVFLSFFIPKSYGQGPEIKDSGLQLTLSAGPFSTSLYVYECGYGIADWKDVMTEDMCGEVVWSGFPDSSGCFANNTPVAGKIVMLWEGNCPVKEKAKLAQQAGAIGMLVVGRSNTVFPPVPRYGLGLDGQMPDVQIPVFYMKASDFQVIQSVFLQSVPPVACFVRPGVFINSVSHPVYEIQQNCYFPQVSPFYFSANLSNISNMDLQDVLISAKLQKINGQEIISSVRNIQEMASYVLDSLFILPDAFNNINLPGGLYQVIYTVEGSLNGRLFTDTRKIQFSNAGSILAKELRGLQAAYRPDTLPQFNWGIGNMFYHPSTLDQWIATYAELAILPSPEMNPVQIVDIYVNLYQLNEGVSPQLDNFAPDGSDMTLIATGSISVLPLEITSPTYIELIDLNTAVIGVPIEPENYYIMAVMFESNSVPMYIGFNEEHVEREKRTLLFKDGMWKATGFYGAPNAVIRMYLDSEIFCPTIGVESTTPKVDFKVSPNPAHNVLHIQTAFEESTDAIITFTDISGKIILTDYRKNLNMETLSYPVEQYPTGFYAVRITTKDASGTQKFVVHKE